MAVSPQEPVRGAIQSPYPVLNDPVQAGFESLSGTPKGPDAPAPGVETQDATGGSESPAGFNPWMPPLPDQPRDAFSYQLQFHVDEATGRVVAEVVDRETGEIVRQVPPEHVLRIAMYLEMLLGQQLDQRG